MKNLILSISLMYFLCTSLIAGEFGSISGNIADAEYTESLPGANIYLEGTKLGASTDLKGFYQIDSIPAGIYTITAKYIGYFDQKYDSIRVYADSNIVLNISMQIETVNGEQIEVQAARIQELADVNAASKSRLPGISTQRANGGANKVVIKGLAPKYNIVSVEGEPNFNTEEYDKIDDSGFFNVLERPLSTFAADVDAASYANTRRFLMQDQMPYKDAVRVEEFINYFSYDYTIPKSEPLSINIEYSECPWNRENQLVHIGLKGKELAPEEQKASNLVFLIDVSGSMDSPKKLPLLKKAFVMLVNQLKDDDKISIVVYASQSGLVLPSTPGKNKKTIVQAINNLHAGGSTAGGEGIQLAYKVAKENFIEGGNNRVILATDGDFNVGISSTSELVRFIEEKKDDGIFLTVLGFGMGNYKDDRLQNLADKGNGNHAYIDNILEAKKVLVTEITSTLFTIAKDVKIQVEFNPAKVSAYRLVGYENRLLDEKDFKDDTKDAGEMGSGHSVTALYEIVPAKSDDPDKQELKYQERVIRKDAKQTNEVLTVKIRYKEPDEDESKEYSKVLNTKPLPLDKSSNNFRFAGAVAEFAMLLRESEYINNVTYEDIKKLAEASMGDDNFGYRKEFLTLVERANILKDK